MANKTYKFIHTYTERVSKEVSISAPEGLTPKQVLEIYFDTPHEHIPDGDKIPPDASAVLLPEENELSRDFDEDIEWTDDMENVLSTYND